MLHPAANSHPEATHRWLLWAAETIPWHASSCSQQAPQGHTSMASYGRPSLPFCYPKTLQTRKTLQTLKNLKTLKTLTWHASSCSQQPPRGHTSMASEATHQWLLRGRLNNPLECFILQPTGAPRTWHASSCSQQPPRGHTSMASYGHPEATHEWLLMGRLNNPLACFILQPTGTPRPHINSFLWASKPAVCQPLNP